MQDDAADLPAGDGAQRAAQRDECKVFHGPSVAADKPEIALSWTERAAPVSPTWRD